MWFLYVPRTLGGILGLFQFIPIFALDTGKQDIWDIVVLDAIFRVNVEAGRMARQNENWMNFVLTKFGGIGV